MQKLTFSLMLGAALFMTACDIGSFALPEKLTVKGEPGVHIPLGNPFEKDPDKSPAKLLSMEKMKEKIAGDLPGAEIYTYDDAAGTYTTQNMQAFLLRYPIADMTYDLSSYMKNDITIPTIPNPGLPAALIPSTGYPITPDIEVSLGDLGTLVKSVTKTKIGIRIKGNYAGKLKISITGGGNGFIVTANTGTYDSTTDGYTEYVDTSSTTWEPLTASSGKVTITVTVIGAIPGGDISPEFVLDWSAATVKPGTNGELEDSRGGFNLTSLKDVFKGIQFERSINAHIYATGLSGTADKKIKLSYGSGSPIELISEQALTMLTDNWETPIKAQIPNGKDYKGDLPTDVSASTGSPFNFKDLINAAIGSEQTLNYKVTIGEIPITPGEKEKKIQAVLYIIIPLSLLIDGDTPDIQFTDTTLGTQAGYVKIKLEGLSDFSSSDDLFGRKNSGDKIFEVIDRVDNVKIFLESFQNGLLDGYIAVSPHSDGSNGSITSLSLDPSKRYLSIPLDASAYPFTPQFEILIPKIGDGGPSTDKGKLIVKRGGEFDFNLAVEAKASLNYEVF